MRRLTLGATRTYSAHRRSAGEGTWMFTSFNQGDDSHHDNWDGELTPPQRRVTHSSPRLTSSTPSHGVHSQTLQPTLQAGFMQSR